MRITVNKNLRNPLYWQISDQIKLLIINGQLVDGAILPSERALAKSLDVHRNTVMKAYSLLKDQELIDSFQGVGYKVTYKPAEEYEDDVRRMVNWSHIIKDEYLDMEWTFDDIFLRFTEENNISLSTGMAPVINDEEEIGADIASILHEQGKRPFYLSPYQGDLTLRQQIRAYLRTKGIRAETSQIQILSETNQALDFIVTALLNPGDSVIVEEPVSPDVYRVIELAGCKAVTVPVDRDGMICDSLEALIETHGPKFIYVNSSYHDPTGNILSIERRKKLLELSNRYRLPIVEEDAASELSFEEVIPPTIKSMDRSENVIYIYSFSLTFIPGLSMAFVVAPHKLIKSLSYLVSVRIVALDWIAQKLLARYIIDGRYHNNVGEIAKLNKEKRDLMCGYLDRLSDKGVVYEKPRGGVYVWCKLPNGVDSKIVVREALKRGISVIPGEIFFPSRNGGREYIRLNYSYETKERLKLGMENLIDILEQLIEELAH